MKNWLGVFFRNSQAKYLAVCCILLVFLVPPTSGLKCYVCGSYTEGEASSITHCSDLEDEDNLKDCSAESFYCMTYRNDQYTVGKCAAECSDKSTDIWSEIYCCKNEDGCNSASRDRLGKVVAMAALSAVVWSYLRLSPNL